MNTWALPSAISGLQDWVAQKPVHSEAPLTVLVFLSPVCPCSRAHESSLRELQKRFSAVNFVGVYSGNASMDEVQARQRFEAASLGFPLVRDKDYRLANLYSAHRTPHAFVLDSQGQVLYQGAVDDTRTAEPEQRYLADALQKLSEGKPLEITSTRPMGCRIER